MADRQINATDDYAERAKKLIPAEIAGAFVAINSGVPLDDHAGWFILLIVGLLAVLSVFYLRRVQSVKSWMQVLFTSAVIFPIWCVNIAYARIDGDMQSYGYVASAAMILSTLAAPLIVKSQ